MSSVVISEIRRRVTAGSGVAAELADDASGAEAVGGLGSSAHAFLGTAVECLIVGMSEPAIELLKKALTWVEKAIDIGEKPGRYFPDGTEALRYRTRGLCRWLLEGTDDTEAAKAFVEHEDRYLARVRDKVERELSLVGYLDAGRNDRVLELCEGHRQLPREVRTPSRVETEAQMALFVALSRLGESSNFVGARSTTDIFLHQKAKTWLTGGKAVRLAEWVKVLYLDRAADSPRDLIPSVVVPLL